MIFGLPQRLTHVALRRFTLLVLILLCCAPALAATPAPAPPLAGTSAADLQKLVGTLQDDQQRAQLIKQLQALIAAQQQGAPAPAPPAVTSGDLITEATARLQQIGDDLADTASVLVDLPVLVSWVEAQLEDEQTRGLWFGVSRHVGEILAAAILVGLLVGLVASRIRRRLARPVRSNWATRFTRLLCVFGIDAMPVICFAVTGYVMHAVVQPKFIAANVASVAISAVLTAGLLQALARTLLLSPREMGWVLLPLSEESANYLYIWVRRFVFWAVYGFAFCSVAWYLRVPGSVFAVLLKAVALVLTVLGVVFVLQNRQAVADWLRPSPRQIPEAGAGEGAEAILADPVVIHPLPAPRRRQALDLARHRLADIWHILVIVYILGVFAVYALRIENGFSYLFRATLLTIAIFVVARLLIGGIAKLANRGFAIPDDLKYRFPTLEHRANRYLPILNVVASTVIWALALLSLLECWGISSYAWLASDTGRRITGSLMTIGTILAIAFLFWEVFNASIDRYLAGIMTNGDKIARSARMRTLLPLLRNVMWVVLLIVIVLVVLSELGVNIAPLLGISAVAGVAIGFGSQALVKDVITGLFILVEDTMAVGDVVDFGGGYAGAVEGMSIRTIRLRDGQGTLHVIPFGEVAKIKNLSRDFAYYVIDLALPFNADPDAIGAILTRIGADMQADPAIGPLIAAPLEIIGLVGIGLDGLKLEARIKTLPLKQWAVQRDFNIRLKRAFDAAGITPPGAGQTISFDPKLIELLTAFQAAKPEPAPEPKTKPEPKPKPATA
jgi:moderate conductance mechanosensitive channel